VGLSFFSLSSSKRQISWVRATSLLGSCSIAACSQSFSHASLVSSPFIISDLSSACLLRSYFHIGYSENQRGVLLKIDGLVGKNLTKIRFFLWIIVIENHAMSGTPEKSPETILYADDTEAQRYAVSHVLRNAGFRVVEASTGQQALEMSVSHPDLIVLDVNLPDINGIEVCKRLKAEESTAHTPVLQVSATQVSTEARVAGLEGGADAYLVQPIEPKELIATVRALLRVRTAEEQLWKSQMQYRSFFEVNPLPCCIFEASDLRILTVNAAAVQHYGYSREEFTAMTLRELPIPEQRAAFLQALAENASSKHSLRTWKHVTKNGRLIDVDVSWAALELNGRNVRLAIWQDITEKLALQVAQHQEEIRRLLLDRALQAQEDERRKIARELHDEAGQLMTSLLVGLRSISDARRLANAKQQAKRLREIASDAIKELARLARGLHSSVLDDLGIEVALSRFADEFATIHAIQIDLDMATDDFSEFSRDEQINLYRIVQEALTNVARHAQAREVHVRFQSSPSDLEVIICDDGCGLSGVAKTSSRHLGIEGMRQRAASLGGRLQISSPAEGGTQVRLQIPNRRRARSNGLTG
jgi:PAS domain S-box-containing protein